MDTPVVTREVVREKTKSNGYAVAAIWFAVIAILLIIVIIVLVIIYSPKNVPLFSTSEPVNLSGVIPPSNLSGVPPVNLSGVIPPSNLSGVPPVNFFGVNPPINHSLPPQMLQGKKAGEAFRAFGDEELVKFTPYAV